MVKRYDGNTGRVIRIPEGPPERGPEPQERRHSPEPQERRRRPPPPVPGPGALPRQLQNLLSGSLGELETEDLLLLLILYLLYRESGDQDWLVTLGAMLFL